MKDTTNIPRKVRLPSVVGSAIGWLTLVAEVGWRLVEEMKREVVGTSALQRQQEVQL